MWLEAFHAIRDYQYQKAADGDTAEAAGILALKSLSWAVGMTLFCSAGLISYFAPPATPPPDFHLRAVVIQLILIAGQFFIFLNGLLLFFLRRLAKKHFLEEQERAGKLEITRDELTEEIRENRRLFWTLGENVVARLDDIQRRLDQ